MQFDPSARLLMRAFSFLGVLLVSFTCLSWSPLSWSPTAQNGKDVQLTIPEVSKKRIKQLEETMQGVWRLTEYKTNKLPPDGRSETGYCMVQSNYISIELHIGWLSEDGVLFNRKDFQSGIHRFEIDQTGRMETSSIIGTFQNQGYQIGFEQPGYKRTYHVEAIIDQMTLRGDDGSKLSFERLPETRAKRDVYGRIIPDKKAGAKSTDGKGDKPTDDTNKPPDDNPPPDKKDEKPPEKDGGGGR
jgi:hypothetical protein